jgi:hypothetical protein
MTDDLVKRLHEVEGEKLDFTNTSNGLRLSAADRIEELSNCVAVLEAKLAKAVRFLISLDKHGVYTTGELEDLLAELKGQGDD